MNHQDTKGTKKSADPAGKGETPLLPSGRSKVGDRPPIPLETDRVATQVVDAVYAVHSRLGPGLLESAYEVCLAHEMSRRGIDFRRQVDLPVQYDEIRLDVGYRLDFLVE